MSIKKSVAFLTSAAETGISNLNFQPQLHWAIATSIATSTSSATPIDNLNLNFQVQPQFSTATAICN
jgi:hypothetical protein